MGATIDAGYSVVRLADPLALEHFASDRFTAKLFAALTAVAVALDSGKRPYVAFSGGKDSLCVAALVERHRDDVPMLWTDDELEYPETVAFMALLRRLDPGRLVVGRGWAEHAGWFRPWRDRPFWRDPLPGTLPTGMDADDWMARRGHDLTFTGVRANESRKRREHLLRVRATEGGSMVYPVKSGTGLRCCPIWNWTEDDVWALIAGWRIPYNAAYDRLEEIGIARERQRIGPLPLTPRPVLADGWPDLLERLEACYGPRW